jgi:hypothetical protein
MPKQGFWFRGFVQYAREGPGSGKDTRASPHPCVVTQEVRSGALCAPASAAVPSARFCSPKKKPRRNGGQVGHVACKLAGRPAVPIMPGESVCSLLTRLGRSRRRDGISTRHQAIAVVLNLMNPVGAGRGGRQVTAARLDETQNRHREGKYRPCPAPNRIRVRVPPGLNLLRPSRD